MFLWDLRASGWRLKLEHVEFVRMIPQFYGPHLEDTCALQVLSVTVAKPKQDTPPGWHKRILQYFNRVGAK
jgi:hypothetical protein